MASHFSRMPVEKEQRKEISMKKRLSRMIAGLLAGAVLASLTGCGGGTAATAAANSGGASASAQETSRQPAAQSGEQKIIKFFHRFPDEPFNGFIEKKIAEYEEMHPDIKLVVESAQNDPYKEKIKVVIAGDDAPDIYWSWCGEFSERFLREGLMLDLTLYLDSDPEWKDSLMESQLAKYNKDGVQYGIPFRLDCKLFFYNTAIFEENGLEVPATWDEFTAVCEKLQTLGITPISYGNQDKWPSTHYIGTLNQLLVSDEVRAADYNPATGEFTDPGYVEALKYYEKIVNYCNDGVNGTTADMARTNFALGKAAMLYAELIEIPYITELVPDFEYGMFNFPLIKGAGNPDILTGVPEGFAVHAKTRYPDECVEFLKWFLGPETGREQAQSIGWFNAAKGVTEGVTDTRLLDGYEVINNAKEMGEWFDNALYSTVADEYMTAISDFTNGDITAEDAMVKISRAAIEAQELISTN